MLALEIADAGMLRVMSPEPLRSGNWDRSRRTGAAIGPIFGIKQSGGEGVEGDSGGERAYRGAVRPDDIVTQVERVVAGAGSVESVGENA